MGQAEGRSVPDYELDERLELTTPAQFKALGDALRQTVLGLLNERAATTSQLAQALNSPTGTMGYHLHVLLDAGLIRVVRTRQVRAMTEKYYGRVARLFVTGADSGDKLVDLLRQAMQEYVPTPDVEGVPFFALRHARIPQEQAVAFSKRLFELVMEFGDMGDSGQDVYGVLAGVYLTNWPRLPDAD